MHLEFKSKILPRPLTDLASWVGFCTSGPQQGVKYQHWYLDLGVLYEYPMKYSQWTAKFLPNWGLDQRYCPGRAFSRLKYLNGILHLKPTAECRISTLIFGLGVWGVGLYEYPMKNSKQWSENQNTTKRKELFSLQRTTFVYVLSSGLVN
jgi:hypothetical protein